MTFDPKIRGPAGRVPAPSTGATEARAPSPSAPQQPAGFPQDSGFEVQRRAGKLAEGRKQSGGVADDTIGRKQNGGVADDTIGRKQNGGVADDTIGRKQNGGVADDTIGRKQNGGVADDTIGVADDTIGVADDTIGRKQNGGVADDTIGVADDTIGVVNGPADRRELGGVASELLGKDAVRDALVGPTRDPSALARKEAVYGFLENPSWKDAELARKILEAAPPQHRAGLSQVVPALDTPGLRRLGALVQKAPDVLADVDSAGNTLVHSLAQIATQPLGSTIAGSTTKAEVLRSLLTEVVNPNRIDQGDAPTCTVTSMQFELVADEPAEYARLMAGLTGPPGKAQMRGGGELRLEGDEALVDSRQGRSVTESIFQSAAMEYANGRAMDFDAVAGKSTNGETGAQQNGLKPLQQTTILRNLFGVRYQTDTLYDEKQGARALEGLRGFDASGAQNRPIVLDLDQGDINHAVTLERIRDGRVYFRDPYGALRSMPDEMFAKYVVAVHRPQD